MRPDKVLFGAFAGIVITSVVSIILVVPQVESLSLTPTDFIWAKPAPSPDTAAFEGKLSLGNNNSDARTLSLQADVTLDDMRDPTPVAVEADPRGKLTAMAHNFGTQAQLAPLFIAFLVAAIFATRIALKGAGTMAGAVSSTFCVGCGALFGAVLIWIDPVGPLVSHQITIPFLESNSFVSSLFSSPPNGEIIQAALSSDIVSFTSIGLISFFLLMTGAVAGAMVLLVVRFLLLVVIELPFSTVENLHNRKMYLSSVIVYVSIALSLGVAIITTFLNWGTGFLQEDLQKTVQSIANSGSNYWGSTFAIVTLATSGIAAHYVHSDINAAALAFADANPDPGTLPASDPTPQPPDTPDLGTFPTSDPAPQPPSPPAPTQPPKTRIQIANEWKKNNDLEFDPIKTVSTTVAALSPILTSVFLSAVSKSVA